MRILIQRVTEASVEVENKVAGKINKGMLIFFATTHDDKINQIEPLVTKLINFRMFTDENNKMNLSLKDVKGDVLVISQFTLYADTSSGRRPSFINAQEPEKAKVFYERFIDELKKSEYIKDVQNGIFGAKMKVSLINDGPVTFIIDAKKLIS